MMPESLPSRCLPDGVPSQSELVTNCQHGWGGHHGHVAVEDRKTEPKVEDEREASEKPK
jgi:hypothetical protein